MQALFFWLLSGMTFVFLPQDLLTEDPPGPQGPPADARPSRPNPELLFNRLDANHDGAIAQDELPSGMPEVFKELLFLADRNGDEKITLDELTTAINQQRPGPDRDVKADSQVKILSLLYADAAETAKIIDGVFRNQDFSVSIDARTNSLILRAPQTLSVKIEALAQKLDVKTPDSAEPPFGRRFRGPEGQADQMPGPPFGRGFGRSEGRPGEMAGPPFGRQGMGPGRMAGPPFGGPGGRGGQMAGPGFRGPGEEPTKKPAGTGPNDTEGSPRIEAYAINKADPQLTLKVLHTLFEGQNNIRMDIDPKNNNLIVLARPQQHAMIRAILDKIQHDTRAGPDADKTVAETARQPSGRPDAGPDWSAWPAFAGPGWRHGQMERPPYRGPYGPPWARPGYGPPQDHWAAFGPMPRGPQGQAWAAYNRPRQGPWQANFDRPQRPGFNLKAIFDRLDMNHDGQLSFDEFSQGMKRLFRVLTHQDRPEMASPGPRGPNWFNPSIYY